MEIEFDKRLFNPVYWHIEDAFSNPDIRNVLIYGGSSASKTYSVCQNLAINSMSINNSSIIFRKESTSIDESVYSDFKSIASNINEYGNYFIIQDRKIKTSNARFVFSGLDDPEKVKGISQFQKAYMNELSKFEYADWKEVQRRLRGKPNQQVIADWNPISEQHWIKTELIDKDEWIDLPKDLNGRPLTKLSDSASKMINKSGDTILIRVTYMDNYWIVGSPCGKYGFYDKHTINNFNRMKQYNDDDYRVYALGLWGRIKTGGEFFPSFDRSKHVKKIVCNPKNAIRVTVDNNVLPYITIRFSQFDEENKTLIQIHEIKAEDPDNTVTRAGTLAREWMESIGYNDLVILLGDSSTKSGNTIDDEKRSFLDKFIEQLEVSYHIDDRVPKSNPSVALSGGFINACWSGELPYNIYINETCKTSIDDYENVKKDANGAILKLRVKNKETGQTYEQYGHFSDCLRYDCVDAFKSEYIKYSNKRKRNSHKENDMNYFNSNTKVKYKDTIVFVIPDCEGKFMAAMIGVHEYADVLKVVFRDDFDDSLLNEFTTPKNINFIFECNKSFYPVISNLRESGFEVRGKSEEPNKIKRITANDNLIKTRFRFISNYEESDDYVSFMNNIMDYNGKENYEALNLLSLASSYINRAFFTN